MNIVSKLTLFIMRQRRIDSIVVLRPPDLNDVLRISEFRANILVSPKAFSEGLLERRRAKKHHSTISGRSNCSREGC